MNEQNGCSSQTWARSHSLERKLVALAETGVCPIKYLTKLI